MTGLHTGGQRGPADPTRPHPLSSQRVGFEWVHRVDSRCSVTRMVDSWLSVVAFFSFLALTFSILIIWDGVKRYRERRAQPRGFDVEVTPRREGE